MNPDDIARLRSAIVKRKGHPAHINPPPDVQTGAIARMFGLTDKLVTSLLATPYKDLDAVLIGLNDALKPVAAGRDAPLGLK